VHAVSSASSPGLDPSYSVYRRIHVGRECNETNFTITIFIMAKIV